MDEQLKQAAKELEGEIVALSRQIHQHPEVGFEEHQAQAWCCQLLERHGFAVEKGAGGIETAFKARFQGKQPGGVRVAFLAEYDSLPGLGHACGHNLIAAAAVGAGLMLSKLADRIGGEIVVMGTPAEGGGGKVIMLENGAFDDVQYAIMMHPSTENLVGRGGRATVKFDIAFHGKGCHSAGPENGINALNALIMLFNCIDNLRPLLPTDANLNGVILDGGKACNVIPDYAHAQFSIRVRTQDDGDVVMGHLKRVIAGVEQITGARAEYTLERGYAERYPNDHIEREIQQKFGIETTAHMDPIATDDESVNRLREQVAALARAVEPEMTIHDFRVTKGPQHTNLIFDVVVPHRCRLRDEELCERLSGAVRALDERYFAVIQVDRAYVETR